MSTSRSSWKPTHEDDGHVVNRASGRAAAAWCATAVALATAAACSKPPQGTPARVTTVDTLRDPQLSDRDLLRDLEATILENYLQLTLGNMEAFADSIAEDREVAIFGVTADDSIIGVNPAGRARERRPFAEHARPTCSPRPTDDHHDETPESARCARFTAKKLDLHLSEDGSVGWIFDEIDYRIPHEAREASIPLRYTAVLVRDIDRWVLVASHMSYAVPIDDIVALAGAKRLQRPHALTTYSGERGLAGLLRRLADRRLNADAQSASKYAERMARKYSRAAADDRTTGPPHSIEGDAPARATDQGDSDGDPPAGDQPDEQVPTLVQNSAPGGESTSGAASYLIPENALLVLLPAPTHEYNGRETHTAPTLASLFGPDARVAITDYRLSAAANRRVAWMAANLEVGPPTAGAHTIGMRATLLFAMDDTGWNLVQSHISVPVTQAQLGERIFGPPRPPPRERQPNGSQDPELAQKREAIR